MCFRRKLILTFKGGVSVIDQYALNMLSVSGEFEKEKKYWLQKLQGDLTPVTFPYDYTASSLGQRQMIEKTYDLPKELSEQLLTFCNHSDYGLYMTFLSAFLYLLNKYTNNVDMIVGSPVFRGKDKEEVLLNDMLPLRMTCDSAMSFKEMMSEIKKTVLEASEHEHFPLQQWLHSDSNGPGSLLYRVVVLLDNI